MDFLFSVGFLHIKVVGDYTVFSFCSLTSLLIMGPVKTGAEMTVSALDLLGRCWMRNDECFSEGNLGALTDKGEARSVQINLSLKISFTLKKYLICFIRLVHMMCILFS